MTAETSIEQARRRYRELMRAAHPDLGGDAETASAINRAMEIVGATPVAPPPATPLRLPRSGQWQALLAASDVLGTIVLADEALGLICVALELPGAGDALLEIRHAGPTVEFRLDTEHGSGPPLEQIVARLQRHIDARG